MRAKDFVPDGAFFQVRSGEMSSPSQVNWRSMLPPFLLGWLAASTREKKITEKSVTKTKTQLNFVRYEIEYTRESLSLVLDMEAIRYFYSSLAAALSTTHSRRPSTGRTRWEG